MTTFKSNGRLARIYFKQSMIRRVGWRPEVEQIFCFQWVLCSNWIFYLILFNTLLEFNILIEYWVRKRSNQILISQLVSTMPKTSQFAAKTTLCQTIEKCTVDHRNQSSYKYILWELESSTFSNSDGMGLLSYLAKVIKNTLIIYGIGGKKMKSGRQPSKIEDICCQAQLQLQLQASHPNPPVKVYLAQA